MSELAKILNTSITEKDTVASVSELDKALTKQRVGLFALSYLIIALMIPAVFAGIGKGIDYVEFKVEEHRLEQEQIAQEEAARIKLEEEEKRRQALRAFGLAQSNYNQAVNSYHNTIRNLQKTEARAIQNDLELNALVLDKWSQDFEPVKSTDGPQELAERQNRLENDTISIKGTIRDLKQHIANLERHIAQAYVSRWAENEIEWLYREANSRINASLQAQQEQARQQTRVEQERQRREAESRTRQRVSYSLSVNAVPGARIKILNIRPAYRPGIRLSPGRYEIEVSAEGYVAKTFWYDHQQNFILNVELEPEVFASAESEIDSPESAPEPERADEKAGKEKEEQKSWLERVLGG